MAFCYAVLFAYIFLAVMVFFLGICGAFSRGAGGGPSFIAFLIRYIVSDQETRCNVIALFLAVIVDIILMWWVLPPAREISAFLARLDSPEAVLFLGCLIPLFLVSLVVVTTLDYYLHR